MMEYYPLKKQNLLVVLPPLAPILFLSSPVTKLLQKLSILPATKFSVPILSWHFSPHSVNNVLVKVITDFSFAHLIMTNH